MWGIRWVEPDDHLDLGWGEPLGPAFLVTALPIRVSSRKVPEREALT